MIEFFNALRDPDILFLRYAFIAGLLASVSFGIIGTYVVARRISSIAGAISHSVLCGVGVGLYLNTKMGITWFMPVYGAVIAALLAAVIIGTVGIYASQREDTIIAAVWSIGMAVGLLFLSITPGYTDPMSYLFGNILLISKNDLWLIFILDICVIGLALFYYNKLLAVCFDEEFARTRGIKVEFYYLLLLCLTALTVVLLMRIVGLILVIALLTLPVALAGHFARRLAQTMVLSVLLCMLFFSTGIGLSYTHNLPSGPVIIVLAGLTYFSVLIGNRILKLFIRRKTTVQKKRTKE